MFFPVQHGQMNKWIYRQVSKILHSQGISVQGGTISKIGGGSLNCEYCQTQQEYSQSEVKLDH